LNSAAAWAKLCERLEIEIVDDRHARRDQRWSRFFEAVVSKDIQLQSTGCCVTMRVRTRLRLTYL